MVNAEAKITTFSSICTILLREVRMERGIHQAQLADWLGKTPSAWTKVEAGKSPLSLDAFFRVCNAMQVMPSAVMATAERYTPLFGNNMNQDRWVVLFPEAGSVEKDDLLISAQEYWTSPEGRNQQVNRLGFNSILNGPIYGSDGTITVAPVFQFALDPLFRDFCQQSKQLSTAQT